jgi:hypothetical protein
MKKSSQSIDQLISNFDFAGPENIGRGGPVTVWLPTEYKAKYDEMQQRSGGKFVKMLKEVLKHTIDQVHSQDQVG